MHDRVLRLLCLILATGGILGVSAWSFFAAPETVLVADIGRPYLGHILTISGSAAGVSVRDGHVFLDLVEGNHSVPVVMFERTARSRPDVYTLRNKDSITVTGKVLWYHNALEIQADEIQRNP